MMDIPKRQSRLIIQLFLSVICLLLLANAGSILVPIYPISSLILALFLYFRAPNLYVAFSLWISGLGALVKRIIDFQSGFFTFGTWSLTPDLVILVSAITFFIHLPRIIRIGGMPYVFASCSIFYGLLLGLISAPTKDVVIHTLSWAPQIFFSFHLFANWRNYPQFRCIIEKSFLWLVIIIGIYGILQFLLAPGWDTFYIINGEATSFGLPEPLRIRVFSTLSSPQDFAAFIGSCLLMTLTYEGPLRFIATPVGHIALLLSAARTAWLSYVVGLITLFITLRSSLQLKLIVSLAIIIALAVPLTTVEPFSKSISQRFESFSNIQNDTSLEERSDGYQQLLDIATQQITGSGIGGSLKIIADTDIGVNDSAILKTLFTLGWVGTIPYLTGLILLAIKAFTIPRQCWDIFIGTGRIISLSLLSQVGLNVSILGSSGLLLWGFLGMSLAGYKYYLAQNMKQPELDIDYLLMT